MKRRINRLGNRARRALHAYDVEQTARNTAEAACRAYAAPDAMPTVGGNDSRWFLPVDAPLTGKRSCQTKEGGAAC